MRAFRLARLKRGVLVALAFALACTWIPVAAKEPKMKDLTDSVLSNRILSKFALLLRFSDQASFLSSRGPFTLFAPTDSAFSRLSPEVFAALQRPENKDTLQRIILFHIVNGQRLSAKDLGPLKTLPSCEGTALPLRVNHTGYQIVSKAKIIHADIRCLNGLLHEIDTVLLPPGVSIASLEAMAATPPPATSAMAAPEPATNGTGTAAPEIPTAPIAPSTPSTNFDTATNAPPAATP